MKSLIKLLVVLLLCLCVNSSNSASFTGEKFDIKLDVQNELPTFTFSKNSTTSTQHIFQFIKLYEVVDDKPDYVAEAKAYTWEVVPQNENNNKEFSIATTESSENARFKSLKFDTSVNETYASITLELTGYSWQSNSTSVQLAFFFDLKSVNKTDYLKNSRQSDFDEVELSDAYFKATRNATSGNTTINLMPAGDNTNSFVILYSYFGNQDLLHDLELGLTADSNTVVIILIIAVLVILVMAGIIVGIVFYIRRQRRKYDVI